QVESHKYPAASLEDDNLDTEKLFYDIDDTRIKTKSTTDASSITSMGDKIYRTHGNVNGEKTGLGITLRVMAGDEVMINAESYYTLPGGGAGSPLTLAVSDLLS